MSKIWRLFPGSSTKTVDFSGTPTQALKNKCLGEQQNIFHQSLNSSKLKKLSRQMRIGIGLLGGIPLLTHILGRPRLRYNLPRIIHPRKRTNVH